MNINRMDTQNIIERRYIRPVLDKATALFIVIFVFFHSLRYFDYIGLDATVYGWVTNLVSITLIVFCLTYCRGIRCMHSSKYLLLLLILPMLSFIPCFIERGQSPLQSLKAYMPTFLVLVYYLLHYAKVSTGQLAKALTIIAVTRTLILIVQQFTYPDFLFAYRTEGIDELGVMQQIEVRSGIYRFYIEDTYLSMFLLFYYFQQLTQKVNATNVSLFVFGLVGIYLDQSRQFMLSAVASLLIVYLFSSKIKSKNKLLVNSLIAFFVIAFVIVGPLLMSDLSEKTEEEMTDDNIRLLSYATFLFEYWGGPLSVIFGNGPVFGDSSYGKEITDMSEMFKIFRSDIGVVGALNLYGITSVIALVFFYIKSIIGRWRHLDLHVKMYFVAFVINLPLISIYTQSVNWFIFFAFMLYFADSGEDHFVKYKMLVRELSKHKNTSIA